MRLINLPSKQLAAIGYNPNTQDLVAQFAKGQSYYHYAGVPEGVFVSIITDPVSYGHAFHEKVRGGGYPFRKIGPEEVGQL